MCSVCGVLGGPAHWSSSQGRLQLAGATTLRADRARSVELLNRIARTRGMMVSDWQGSSFVVAGATGGQEVVNSLGDVWAAMDRLGGRSIDPLGDEWLA
jgi:hypothetical protein